MTMLTPEYISVANNLSTSRLVTSRAATSRFVIVEGCDGSGKSSLASSLASTLAQRYGAAEVLRQPGGTPVGETLRKALKTPQEPVSPTARYFLMEASRALTADAIRAQRAAGDTTWFVADRFHDSGVVYQSLEGVDEAVMNSTSGLYMKDLIPTITFYLSVSPEVAFSRLNARENGAAVRDAYDDSSIEQLAEIIRRYELRVFSRPGFFYVLDANKSQEEVLAQALKVLETCPA